MKDKYVPASEVVSDLCRELNYSRAHVAKVLRDNSRSLRAKKHGSRQWTLPRVSIPKLRRLIEQTSGPRYKLGETGPNS